MMFKSFYAAPVGQAVASIFARRQEGCKASKHPWATPGGNNSQPVPPISAVFIEPADAGAGAPEAMAHAYTSAASSPRMTDEALWLYASQLLDKLESMSTIEEEEEEEKVTPTPRPVVEFDATIKCHSTPACATLTFATIQDYQWHLMTHVKLPSPLGKHCKTSHAARQRCQQPRPASVAGPQRQRRSLPMAVVSGRRKSLPARMAALSLQDRRPSAPACHPMSL